MDARENVSKCSKKKKVFRGSFLSGTMPKSNVKAKFFFLRHLLLSEAHILCMKCQLNSITGTMKILATEHMRFYANWYGFCLGV